MTYFEVGNVTYFSKLRDLDERAQNEPSEGTLFFGRLDIYRLTGSFLEAGFMSDGKFNERQIAAQIEFLQNVGAVRVNRAVADEKLCADFPAGFVFGDQF